jgi:hypothetical protein
MKYLPSIAGLVFLVWVWFGVKITHLVHTPEQRVVVYVVGTVAAAVCFWYFAFHGPRDIGH